MKIPKNAKINFRRFRGGSGEGTYVGQTSESNGTWIMLNQGDKKSPKPIKVRPAQVLRVNGEAVL